MGFVGARSYDLWQKGPWELPQLPKGRGTSVAEEPKKDSPRPQLASTKNIIDKNLFDPERGASRVQESEASAIAVQRIRSVVLLGTAILGSSSYAILQGPSDPRPSPPGSQGGAATSLRLKLGDLVEGFKLSEIHEKKVIFTKGSSKVEVALDFFRKVEQTKQGPPAPTPPRPGIAPRVPRPPGGEAPAPSATP